jgi:hypothetical protein
MVFLHSPSKCLYNTLKQTTVTSLKILMFSPFSIILSSHLTYIFDAR